MNELILLVDDDTLVRDSLTFALEDAGHEVVPAGNGDEGLAAIAEHLGISHRHAQRLHATGPGQPGRPVTHPGHRPDRAEREEAQKKVLAAYLPAALSAEELDALITEQRRAAQFGVTQAELDELAEQNGVGIRVGVTRSRREVRRVAECDREQLRSVQQGIIFDKAVDFLVSKAKVNTVQPKA